MLFINFHTWIIFYVLISISTNILCQKKEFRSEKINYIYEKAKFLYDKGPKIEKLKNELEKFDKIVLNLKQSKNLDKKEIYEVDRKMVEMLNKYGLEEAAKSFSTKYKHEHSLFVEDSSINKINKFEDFEIQEVQKLWSQTCEITQKNSEKKMIYDILVGYQDDLKRYYELIKDINEIEMKENNVNDDYHYLIASKKKEAKLLNNQLEDQYIRIIKKIGNLQTNPFLHEVVRKLYNEVITSKKFSEDEEKTLRNELRSLQEQFFRLDYHKNQLEEVSQYEKKEAVTEDIRKNEEMAEMLKKKVKKYTEYLRNRINPHLEL
ncbi:Alpha-2-macroglobulin receptor-associated protein, domain 1-containing protein [Strongyloides ratti]|uniref:Alpha-2-macroglobulin receptor-associated protein, domain 1-containing protein n=1 Tax=Strongyloides ratti TaxID=34506 RepID=A0A090L5M8_STRRB|nr:Alpha-2-macroglobulin receptor-associated protein, domain 1-containing protein [Strongyloides ratti]CEF62779.1 Alpha-2-macroglobulin receptor-associated protein, domain 1-containing protein [Strongyloides ratti]